MLQYIKRFNIMIMPEASHIPPLPYATKENPQKKASSKAWNWLFLVPFLGLLWPPLYAKTDPVVLGFPFFYWYQFAWVIVSALLTGVVYLATRRR